MDFKVASGAPLINNMSKKTSSYHHGDLRLTLIATALQLLKSVSASELSLRKLAAKAGVSAAAPYRHFKDKDELIAAVMAEGFEKKSEFMADAILKSKGDPEKMMFDCAAAYFRMGLLHPQHFKLMATSHIEPSPQYPELLAAAAKSFLILKNMILFCQKKGLVGPGDVYHKAMNCWCVVHGFTSLYVEGRLSWLGVTEKNGEAAIRTLVSQYLMGNKNPLAKSEFGFKPFQTPESDWQKKEMLDQDYPEIERLFVF